jgi:aromatic ring-opening dioxygenase catalytic subunit (LigB family)
MLPTLFLSHGSPMHALQAGRAGTAWAAFGRDLPRPKAVLIASAHWESEWPMLTTGGRPETIHDFGGFPPALYELRYGAPGAPAVAERAIELIRAAGIAANGNGCRGLDHGAWVPLRHMYPQAEVPVVQVSLQPLLGAAHHLRLGEILAPLRDEGVLIIGSGMSYHNLRAMGAPAATAPSRAFDDWLTAAVEAPAAAMRAAALTQWQSAPAARLAHPREEHLLPLMVAAGAGGADRGRRIYNDEVLHCVVSAYRFG